MFSRSSASTAQPETGGPADAASRACNQCDFPVATHHLCSATKFINSAYNRFMRDLSRIALLLASAALSALHAQGTKTREDASKYVTHASFGAVALGADFWGHFVPLADGETLRTDNYLVVEVALFAPPTTKVEIDPGQFVLKVNGQRILPDSPGRRSPSSQEIATRRIFPRRGVILTQTTDCKTHPSIR